MVYGIDYKAFNALSKGFLFRDGRPFEGPDEVIADDIIAQTRHLKVGSQITLLNHAFTVCGIVAHGKGARYFIPIRTAQEIAGAEKRVSMFYVRSKGDMEATREIGILKALGFSRFDVVRMLLGETLVLTLLGTGFGIALTFLTQAILKEAKPDLPILISSSWLFAAALLALVGASAGAIY